MTDLPANPPRSELFIYQTEDGRTRIQVRLEDETVWLSQKLMAELFQKDVRTINEHIRNIFAEGELSPESVIRNFRITASDGKTYDTQHYNLDVVISVGYRVKSHRGTLFALGHPRLREYIVKGFTLDDERLKQRGGQIFRRVCWRRIRDSGLGKSVWRNYSISTPPAYYDPNTEMSRRFFQIVQNKMHWAAHGHTAAEIIAARADARKPHMGLTSWAGVRPVREDIEVAKNYLSAEELDTLNRIVTMYLDFAELQALSRRPMYMKDWIAKLDEFLKVSERDILTHAGRVSHEAALEKARDEYEKYREQALEEPPPVERHFIAAVEEVKKLEKKTPRRRRKNDDL